MFVVFVVAIYVFESGKKDPNATVNEPPSGVIGR